MGGKTVARDCLLLRTGGSYSYLLLPRKKNLGGVRHSSSEPVPAPALRLTRKSGALGSKLSFWSRIQSLIQIFGLHLDSLALLVSRNRDERSLVSLKR
jgi:hypothetical protein